MNTLALGGLGVGLIGSIGQLFGAGKANRQLRALQGQIPTYQSSPYAQQRLDLAKTALNADMPGISTMSQGINTSQNNALANINRNATDSSQALALANGVQGQTNQAYNQLGLEQGQYKQQALQNLNAAQEGMINEGDKVYQSQVNRFGDLVQLQGAQNANRQNAWGSIANLGFGMADLGINGGGSLFGGGGSGGGGGMNASSLTSQVPGGLIPTIGMNPQMINSTGYINPNVTIP